MRRRRGRCDQAVSAGSATVTNHSAALETDWGAWTISAGWSRSREVTVGLDGQGTPTVVSQAVAVSTPVPPRQVSVSGPPPRVSLPAWP